MGILLAVPYNCEGALIETVDRKSNARQTYPIRGCFSLTVSQTLKGSSGLKGFQCHWGGVRLVLGGGPGVHRSGGSPETHDTQFVLRSIAVQNLSCEVLRY